MVTDQLLSDSNTISIDDLPLKPNGNGELFRKITTSFILNVFGKALSVSSKIILSNTLKITGFGLYETILSLIRFWSSIIQFGFNQSIVYYLPFNKVKGRQHESYSLFIFALKMIVFLASLLCIAAIIFHSNINNWFFKGRISITILALTLIFLLPFSISLYFSFVYRGLMNITHQISISSIIYPLSIVMGFFVFWVFGVLHQFTLTNILIYTVLIYLGIVFFCFFHLRKLLRKQYLYVKGQMKMSYIPFIRYSIPIWFNSGLTVGMGQADKLLLAILYSPSSVGMYMAPFTVVTIMRLSALAFTPVIQPMIAEAYAIRDFSRMNELYNIIVRWTAILVLPTVGLLIIYGKAILLLFGKDFQAAYPVLIVLCISEIANALSGPGGNVLLMAKRQNISVKILLIGFAINLLLYIFLIPKLAALGAAISLAVGILVINLLRMIELYRTFNILTNKKTIHLILFSSVAIVITWILVSSALVSKIVISFFFLMTMLFISYAFIEKQEKQMIIDQFSKIGFK